MQKKYETSWKGAIHPGC